MRPALLLRTAKTSIKMSTRLTRSVSRGTSESSANEKPIATTGVKETKSRPTKRKANGADKAAAGEALSSMAPPSTPPPKRARSVKAAPRTPPAPGPETTIPIARPAEPHITNAALVTPHGTRHTAYPLGEPLSPSLPPPTATTASILSAACAHLIATDPRLAPIIAANPCPVFTPTALSRPVDPFKALVSSIISQQVSGAAAKSIERKFVGLFNEGEENEDLWKFPLPEAVAITEIPRLRTAGLSGRKAEYVQGLAQKFVDKELNAALLVKASWDEVLERLIAVRGLGRWSVEMFACFTLKRMDIFSTGDLGVQRGMAALMGKDVKKLKSKGGKWKYMTEAEMLEYSEKFTPYRSLLMWYMWQVENVNVDIMQNN